MEYIQDIFDSISAFFLGDSAQQAEREDEEDEYYDDDEDYRWSWLWWPSDHNENYEYEIENDVFVGDATEVEDLNFENSPRIIIREEDEEVESRSGAVFVPLVEDGGAELRVRKNWFKFSEIY